MIITDVSIRNRTTVAVLGLIIILMGGYSYLSLPREAFPDIPIPQILINTVYEGVSPEDIETSITMKIEKELNSIRGVKEIRSSSAEGLSMIDVEFNPDVPTEVALQRVRDRVDIAKGELPLDAEEPVISEINFAEFPIMLISISGDVSPVQLKGIADTLQDTLETVPGVLKVNISGDLEPEIRLEFDPDRLAQYNLTLSEVLALIPSENVNISAGGIETEGTKFHVRIPAELVTAEDVDHLLLTVRNGKPIYLADVANVRATFKDRTSLSRLNGADNITLSVQKRVGANVVHISDYIKAIIDEAQQRTPGTVDFEITFDMSKYIRNIVTDLENNIMAALVLVSCVLLLFLGWRSASIVAMIIPLSMLITFFLIQMLGYTLNMIVLFSLVLVLGMLVDNAIVITENIYRYTQLGHNRLEAAILGAREVAWPVITSTLTTVCAFLPLMFWPGMMGDFMKYLPITLSLGLLSSLFVALVFSPTICSFWLSLTARKRQDRHWFLDAYRRVQKIALLHPVMTLFLAVCLLIALVSLYVKIGKGTEFFPEGDPERAMIDVRAPQGTNIHETDRIVRLIEQRIAPYKKYIKHTVTNVGSSSGGLDIMSSAGGPHLANITLTFYDFVDRERPSMEIIALIREDIADIAGAEIKIEREEDGPPTGAPVTVRIMGEDFDTLRQLSSQAQRMISDVPNLVNLRSDYEAARPELAFIVDRRNAMLFGVNTATVGNFLKMAVFGTRVGSYRRYDDEYDITVRLPLARRVNIDELSLLRIPNSSGRAVPLSSLGHFEYRGGFGTINHVDQKRVITLTADTEGRLSSEVLMDVEAKLAGLELQSGYEIAYAGEKEEQEEAQAFLSKAFCIALLLVVLVLVIQFNSMMIPLIIMTTVILSLIGALTGLLICDLPFGIIMTGIGVISLAGVVVNNAIVLLAYTRQLQERGMDLISAAAEAGVTRLRPVLLTAVTTIIGLIPMAVGISYDFHTFSWATKSESAQWWRNMAVVVIFGLSFATILTLVVVPSLYVMLSHLSTRLGFKKFGAGNTEQKSEQAGLNPAANI
ncbi:MAG: efflux RND transporter permease subunit [Sedimentisphaerales bacterium]|nr:efflux RND transporter permease subunit [Sedimentisphaerales bacterium]